jgi:hypothetical protein
MDGDAGAVRASAGKWSSFGSAAAEASGQITSIDPGEFVGPEGDLFRHGLNKDMPRHLQITGDAFGKVAGALTSFAARLESLQEQMRPLAQRAPGLWAAVQAAQGRLDRAHSADQAHARQQAAQPPPSAGPPPAGQLRVGRVGCVGRGDRGAAAVAGTPTGRWRSTSGWYRSGSSSRVARSAWRTSSPGRR